MRGLLLTALVLSMVPFVLLHPYFGVLVWTWLSLMNPHKLTWGFARTFPFAQIVGIATLLAMMNSTVKKRWPLTRETAVLLIFLVWMLFTTALALNPDEAWAQMNKVAKVLLIVFVTMALIVTRRQLQMFIWVMVMSIGFYGIKGGLFTFATGGAYRVRGPSPSFISGENHLGLALVMMLPMMRYLQRTTPNPSIRLAILAMMVLTVVATLGTHTRGAALGLAAVLFMLVIKGRGRLFLSLLLAGTLFAVPYVMPERWFEQMDTIRSYEDDRSALGRLNAWQFAVNLALERPIGGGFMCFTEPLFARYAPNPHDVHDAHSIYFEVLGEQGFIGLFLFLLLAVLTWRSCSKLSRQASRHEETAWASELGKMLQVSLVGYAVAGAFVGLAYFDLYYNLIAVVVAARYVLAQENEAMQETEEGEDVDWSAELTPAMR